jgi:hypothetical protein
VAEVGVVEIGVAAAADHKSVVAAFFGVLAVLRQTAQRVRTRHQETLEISACYRSFPPHAYSDHDNDRQ